MEHKDREAWLASWLVEQNGRAAGAGGRPIGDAVPSLGLAVVTCMDVRIDPLHVLGLSLGQAHVLRNAGARVTDDVVRSLVISQQALSTDAVVLMPHTRCGVLGLDGSALRSKAEAGRSGSLAPIDFRAMTSIEASLQEDMAFLRQHPWMPPGLVVVGLVLDIDSLRVHRPEGR